MQLLEYFKYQLVVVAPTATENGKFRSSAVSYEKFFWRKRDLEKKLQELRDSDIINQETHMGRMCYVLRKIPLEDNWDLEIPKEYQQYFS